MDKIFEGYLRKQEEQGIALAAASDVLKLIPLRCVDGLAQHFIAQFDCHSFIEVQGQIKKADHFEVGIFFPNHYLREANAFEVLTWLSPSCVFHPNIRPPFICVGEQFLRPGTKLVEILYQLHAIIRFAKWAAHSPLNESAAQWARNNQHLFPADRRPLKRRSLDLQISLSAGRGQT